MDTERLTRFTRHVIDRAGTLTRLVGHDLRGFLRPAPVPLKALARMPDAFHPVFFSHAGDVAYLQLALQSLARLALPSLRNVYVYSDCSKPIDAGERPRLSRSVPFSITWRTTRHPTIGWGVGTILAELDAFAEIAREVPAHDYLVKCDSDILFVSDAIFRALRSGEACAAGQCIESLHHGIFGSESFQGGCYFLRAGVVSHLLRLSLSVALRETAQRSRYSPFGLPEDRIVSTLVRRAGIPIHFEELYFTDMSYLRSAGFSAPELVARLRADAPKRSVIHFELCKQHMAAVYAEVALITSSLPLM